MTSPAVMVLLDVNTQISAFVKLKLADCAPISGQPESVLYRVKVGQIETRLSAVRPRRFYRGRSGLSR
jgi:hypothetical protein